MAAAAAGRPFKYRATLGQMRGKSRSESAPGLRRFGAAEDAAAAITSAAQGGAVAMSRAAGRRATVTRPDRRPV